MENSRSVKFATFMKNAGKVILAFLKKYRYFFEKVGISLLTLALSTILLFFILRQVPGDIVQLYALKLQNAQGITYDRAYELAVDLLNYDPNENVFQAFFRYMGGLMQGELGESYLETGVSANTLIATRLPWTLFVSSVALFISLMIKLRRVKNIKYSIKNRDQLEDGIAEARQRLEAAYNNLEKYKRRMPNWYSAEAFTKVGHSIYYFDKFLVSFD